MTTLSGIASKGEKGKSKFQSLDINSLYRGESLEPHQQKSTLPRKHGMQSLGKVPSARRPPANLPSLKSEHSGNDPAISLVPSGGTGWGSKPGETGQPATPSQPQQAPAVVTPSPVVASQPPVASVIPNVVSGAPPSVAPSAPTSVPSISMQQAVHSGDKLWSSVMASPGEGGAHPPSFLAHQSPQFQQQFPKLSSGDGQAPATGQKGGSDTQYGPGPSLRPQTEGSWIQGGGRTATQPQTQIPAGGAVSNNPPGATPAPVPLPSHIPPGNDPVGGRSNLAPCVAPGVGTGPGGQGTTVPNTAATNTLPGVTPPPGGNLMTHMPPNAGPHQFRNIMPQFIYRNFPPNFQGPVHGAAVRPRFPYSAENRYMSSSRPAAGTANNNEEEIVPRPIIKEEELSKMDDISRDAGWATHDDDIVDYNQKLLFSDDESTQEEETRKDSRSQLHPSKEEKRPERESESSERERERDEHREDHREKRPESVPPRITPADQRNWQQSGRTPSLNMDFRSPTTPPAVMSGPAMPVMRPATLQSQGSGQRVIEEERKRQVSAVSIERAKQRKEEEEKRYQMSKQGAARKLQELEQKLATKGAEPKEHVEESNVSSSIGDWGIRDKERDCNERERDRSRTSSEGRDEKGLPPREARDSDFRQLPQMTERSNFTRVERDRERDTARSEREREREIRCERERKGRDPRGERHEYTYGPSHFQSNLPPRFCKMTGYHHSSSGPSGSTPITTSGSTSQGPTSSGQGSSFSQGPPAVQAFDQRWNNSSVHSGPSMHFPGQLTGTNSSNNIGGKSSHAPLRRSHADSEASSSDRERDRDRDPDDRDRPPSRDPRERRDRHTPESHDNRDRYRQNARERDHRLYTDSANSGRKMSGTYYDGGPEYGRSYSRGSQDFDGRNQDYNRSRERDSEAEPRDRLGWDRHERRESDNKKDLYDRHASSAQQDPFDDHERDSVRNLARQDSSSEWRQQQVEGDRRDQTESRREREERPQRPDSRDSRASRDSRNSRDSTRDDRSMHEEHKLGLQNREFSGSWADSTVEAHFLEPKEEKKKTDFFREERRDMARHPPGPITREKLEASELRNENKHSLTQLKRSSAGIVEKKFDPKKESQSDKMERKLGDLPDVWNRNTQVKNVERQSSDGSTGGPSNRFTDLSNNKTSWADSLSPEIVETPSKAQTQSEEILPASENKKDGDKDVSESALEIGDKAKTVSRKEPDVLPDDSKKLEEGILEGEGKREKGSRSRSRGSRGRPEGSRVGRQSSGGYAVYRGGNYWGPQRDGRGRRGLHRVPPPPRSADWTHGTDTEPSADDSVESGKEDVGRGHASNRRRPDRDRDSRRPPRSPKQGQKKLDKEEKNQEPRRTEGEKTFGGSDSHKYDKRNPYESVRSGREGFAPCGEPSRRGRGGFRTRGSVGRRVDGYGPPSSKSPFGQPSEDGKSQGSCDDKDGRKHIEGVGGETNLEDLGGEAMSSEDKMKLKQQALSAGIIGSNTRHYSGSGGGKPSSAQVPPRMQRKSESERRDSSRSKGRGGRGGSHLQTRTGPGSGPRQNSSDIADDWETTSEHSEVDERDTKRDIRNGRKPFSRRDGGGRRSGGPGGSNSRPPRGNTSSPTGGGSSRAPGAEKRPGVGSSGYGPVGPRGPGSGPPSLGGSSQSNGRGPSSRSNNQTPPIPGVKTGMKDSTSVNRVDEIKVNDPVLVNQAISDLNMTKKNVRVEKDKTNALDGLDLNNFASVVVVDDQPGGSVEEERFNFDADSGFQEVRSKKNVKEARHKEEQKVQQRSTVRDKENTRPKGSKPVPAQVPSPVPGPVQLPQVSQLPQQQLQQQPQPPNQQIQQQQQPPIQQPLPVPTVQGPKSQFDRQRTKLPPRLAKKRETSRMQKAQQQQQQHVGVHNDVSEMNKINQNVSLFPMKDSTSPAPPPSVNAWDKPITASLQPNSPITNAPPNIQIVGGLTSSTDNCGLDVNEQPPSGASSQRSTPNGDKAPGKLSREVVEKNVLDGTTPPVQTIIFENTNYKSAPGDLAMKAAKFPNHLKAQRLDKSRECKLGEDVEEVQLGFGNKNSGSVTELNKSSDNKTDPIQMPLSFSKNEDGVDMKLDFTFESELSQLTDDKKNKGMRLSRSIHMSQGVPSAITHPADDLNKKIQSVKKVWEEIPATIPTVHNEDGSVASTASSFTPAFGNSVDSGLDPSSFSKGVDGPNSVTGDDGLSINPGEVVYSSGPPIQTNPSSYTAVSAVPSMVKNDPTSTSSNVCKVKPQQQAVISAGPSPIGHPGPLSPPPFNSNTQPGHINYQPTLGGTTAQFGSISAIPSPPTVLYNSSQQIPGQGGLYGTFQLDGTQVLGGQPRSQFSGFPPYGLNQGLGQTSAFNQQSMYLQTAPHPPPSAAPDLYPSSLSQYRIQAAQAPFGQSQQLSSNPSTVLISSTSNSLMSASVKPSSQQIGAIGTKAGGPYQQNALPSAPQPSQLYIQYDPNYLSGSQMVQRTGPVQSNVVPTIPHSSSFYSGSAGGQTGFYQAGSSTLQQAPSAQPLHQTGSPYGLQGYGTQSGAATPVGLQGFGSQMAQPYRGTNLPGTTFLKSDHGAGSNGRAQLKSPSNNPQEVLTSASVFSSAPQIPSPKSRGSKQPSQQQQSQQQQSPTQQQPQQQQQQQQPPPHHKYNPYQGMSQSSQLTFQPNVRGQMNLSVRGSIPPASQRYPTPIQRPVTFSQGGGAPGNNMIGRHRPQHPLPSRPPSNINKLPGGAQPYYGSHGSSMKMEGVTDGKGDNVGDGKVVENNSTSSTKSPVTSSASQQQQQQQQQQQPAENGKEESTAPAATAE